MRDCVRDRSIQEHPEEHPEEHRDVRVSTVVVVIEKAAQSFKLKTIQ